MPDAQPAPLTVDDLQAYLDREGIFARLIRDLGHTPTVPAAAAALGVASDQIIKTLLFVLDGGPTKSGIPPAIVVIGCGERHVDRAVLARHFGLNAKRIKLAHPDVVLAQLGYPAGGVPPFGHRTTLPVIVDAAVLALRERYADRIFGGGGDDHTMLELRVSDLLRIHAPLVLPLSPAVQDPA
jgi:prolyl-tRNA editing enzyme YbaK/EbsC (Cys-tRNA(Pro) deacylase)